MDRRTWLAEQRLKAEQRFDRLYSPTYDEDDGPIPPTHRRFVEKLIESSPPGGVILDAPCGTGRYFPMVLEAGRSVVGIDQSAGMLAKAHTKHPDVVVEKLDLQELEFEGEFDAAMCVDAMEFVFPEDWPLVLSNLRRAVRPGGLIYLTIEKIDPVEIATIYEEAKADGLPVVHGENVRRGGGYHYYPTPDRVSGWLEGEGLHVVDEGISRATNYAYHHVLVRPDRPFGSRAGAGSPQAGWRGQLPLAPYVACGDVIARTALPRRDRMRVADRRRPERHCHQMVSPPGSPNRRP